MTILVDTYSKKDLKTLYLKPEIIDIIPQIYIHSPLFVAEKKNAKQKKTYTSLLPEVNHHFKNGETPFGR